MGILDKVKYICDIANKQTFNEKEKEKILLLSDEHSNDSHLGKVFGYSVSDFAIACLSWCNCNQEFENIFDSLSEERKIVLKRLINSDIYKQLS